jgi:hypothetical protein
VIVVGAAQPRSSGPLATPPLDGGRYAGVNTKLQNMRGSGVKMQNPTA